MKIYHCLRQWILYFIHDRNSFWIYKTLPTCPQPPQKFIDMAKTANPALFGPEPESANYESGKNPRLNRLLVKPGKKELEPSVRNPRYELGQEFDLWLKENILQNFDESVISISHQGHGKSFGPHTDRWRCYVLMYIVDTGGTAAQTTFWRQKFYPAVRDNGITINDYTNLRKIDSAIFQQGQWVVVKSRILHSVENIDTVRIAFQISVDDLSELERFSS
jgi:hypothetical protein